MPLPTQVASALNVFAAYEPLVLTAGGAFIFAASKLVARWVPAERDGEGKRQLQETYVATTTRKPARDLRPTGASVA